MIEVGKPYTGAVDSVIEYIEVDGIKVGIVANLWERKGREVLAVTQDWKLCPPPDGRSIEEYIYQRIYWRALETIALVGQGYEPCSVADSGTVVWEKDA